MNRAERRRLDREKRNTLDIMTVNFKPYKLLTYEEKQQYIKRMLQLSDAEILAEFESKMRKLEFRRQSNNGCIVFKARTDEEFTNEEFIELNAKNISGYKAKKEELIEIINIVKTINQWE